MHILNGKKPIRDSEDLDNEVQIPKLNLSELDQNLKF